MVATAIPAPGRAALDGLDAPIHSEDRENRGDRRSVRRGAMNSAPRGLPSATPISLRSDSASRSIGDQIRSRVGELAQWAMSANAAPADVVREAACALYDALDVLKIAEEKLGRRVDGLHSHGEPADCAVGDGEAAHREPF